MTRSVFTKKYERLRDMLIDARQNAGLSQAEVAARLKRNQTFVSKYERGERRIDVVEFLEVARVLGFDPLVFIRQLEKQG
jgi:transcriptional regulator with XRE-family HTH domain